MNVDVTDDSRKRLNGAECILCMECVKNCPKDAFEKEKGCKRIFRIHFS